MCDLLGSISLGSFLFSIRRAKDRLAKDAAVVWARWEQAYNSGDVDKFVALYSKDALLFGSTAELYTGTEGLRTYFIDLPAGIRAKMGHQQTLAVGLNVLLTSGFVDFTLRDDTMLSYRLTLAVMKVGGQWLIAQHHGSPVPK